MEPANHLVDLAADLTTGEQLKNWILMVVGNLFAESPEDQAEKARNAMAKRARDQALRQEDAFIKTNR